MSKKGVSKQKVSHTKKAAVKTYKFMKPVKTEVSFVVVDGSTVKSIHELAQKLEHMGDEVFYHHVTDDRNDFGNWIKDVFSEHELAKRVFLARTKEKVHLELLKHIVKELMA